MPESPVRVLLVEDSPSDAELLQEHLVLVGEAQFQVTHVERLDEALARLSAETFDVVLLDLSLPDSSGHDTFLRAQHASPHAPLIVLSGTSDDLLGIEAVRHGIQDYLVKGQADGQQIARAIRYAIERKRMEEALRESEERFRLASDAAQALVYDVNLMTGKALSVHGMRAMLGFGHEEQPWTSDWWFSRIHPDDRATVRRHLQEAFDRGSRYSIQYRVLHRDGRYFIVEDTGQGVADADGRHARIVGGIVDITRRNDLEHALRESEERLRLAVNAANEAIWDWNLLEGTVQWNTTYAALFGRAEKPDADAQWPWRLKWLHPDDRERVDSSFHAALDGDSESWSAEYRFLRIEGTWANVYERAFIARDESGRPTRIVSAMLDITSLRAAEEALLHARDELEERVRERTEELTQTVAVLQDEVIQRTQAEQALRERSDQLRLLASELTFAERRERQRLAQVLHDGLQQLLVGAKFRLALLDRADREKDVREAVKEVCNLIDDSIETSRSLTSELSPPILRAGLVPALEWLVRWMRDKHGLTVELEAIGKVEPVAEDVTALLFQATREILFNVVKHAGVKSARVQAVRRDSNIELTITDQGVGFDPARLRAIGGAFGGFGLFSMRERLNLLGGRMEIESSPGRGSRFTLVSPPQESTAGGMAAPDSQPPDVQAGAAFPRKAPTAADGKRIRILLVDDHTIMRQGISRLLQEEQDLEIAGEASDGVSAIELAHEILPDVVLMDVSMPGMSGIEATRIIHAELPDIRIIGLSMFEEAERAAALLQAGAVAYLSKSGPSDAVVAAIRACVRPKEAISQGKH